MTLGFRGRMLVWSMAALLAAGLLAALVLEPRLRRLLLEQNAEAMDRLAATCAVAVEVAPALGDMASVDRLADELGRRSAQRVTIIGASGVVLGDSSLDLDAIRHLENYAARPEVAQALGQGEGRAARYSTTLDVQTLYIAQVFSRPELQGVVRVAMPLRSVQEFITALRLSLAGALGLALLLALGLTGMAANRVSATLRALVSSARALARGERDAPLPAAPPGELGVLAGSLRALSGELDATVRHLAAERARLSAVLESLRDGVVALDPDGRVQLHNRAAAELLRLDAQALGQPLLERVRAPALHALLDQARAGLLGHAEFELPASPPRLLQALASPLQGTPGLVLVLHDVSELRRMETVRRDFVANVSHELKTPLSVIQANAEALLDGALGDPAAARRFVGATQRHAERLTALVEDLLELARIESGTRPPTREPTALGPVLQRALDAVAAAAAARQQQLAPRIDGELAVLGDAVALEQVLGNLLDNAVKYTPVGGHLRLHARALGERVRIEVEDDGPGIALQHRLRVFERFYRVDAGRSRALGGTGLGLSIVKHLVEGMGGRVGFEPVEPHGSRFWLELPAAA